jgi:hypothetical protein
MNEIHYFCSESRLGVGLAQALDRGSVGLMKKLDAVAFSRKEVQSLNNGRIERPGALGSSEHEYMKTVVGSGRLDGLSEVFSHRITRERGFVGRWSGLCVGPRGEHPVHATAEEPVGGPHDRILFLDRAGNT